MLLLIVQLLLMLLRLGYEDDRGKAVLRLDAGVRLQAAVLGRIGAGLAGMATRLGLLAVRAGGALRLVGAAVADVSRAAVHAAAVAHRAAGG